MPNIYPILLAASLCLIPLHAAKANPRPFFTKYCASCHGADEPKGDRRFDRLPASIGDDETLVDFQDILDQLDIDEMPPPDELQPSVAEKQAVADWLTRSIADYHKTRKSEDRGTTLRRLNSREYRNTIRDLLHLDMTMFDPTVQFPNDQTTQHLDNVGETLVTSGHLLAQYLAAAELAIDKAIHPAQKPKVQKWKFRDGFRQQPEVDQVHRKTNGFEHMTLYEVIGADKHEGAYGPILAFKKGVPSDGVYELRIKAEAVNRLHPYDPKFLGTDRDEPLRLGIVAGNHLVGPLHVPQPIEPLLAEFDLADEAKWYTVRVWLDAGYTPRFTFQNGLMDVRRLWTLLIRKYADQFPARKKRGIVEARFNAIKFGKLPRIHIHEIEIEGPFHDTWPKPSQRVIFGKDFETVHEAGEISNAAMRRNVKRFASHAYRRPATNKEVDRVVQVIVARQATGRSSLDAFADGLKMVLCSPKFLYLDETSSTDESLAPFALASRLSYFLWSTKPDNELLHLAARKQLGKTEVLAAQVERMLSDPKSAAFVNDFLDNWLTLRDLGSMPPDRSKFRDFYQYDLGTAMRKESRLFARHLIDNDLSIKNFLDSKFTFVNKPLARLYGCDAPKGNGFELVRLTDRRRGGLLGQASVLTVTANGIDTSPVVRGVWMLENLLGTPPSPPPADVALLDPDIRGAKTIREQLKKHRNVASCNDCHRKIDPIGFALENFDPIGGWRETYGRRTKVDASGVMPNGESFQDIRELKGILVEQQSQFTKALTEKLLAYSTGRKITPADRPSIDAIVQKSHASGDGFRSLIKLVAMSEPFRSE